MGMKKQMIIKSTIRKGWKLKIGDPTGTAYLEIHGLTHHLDKPYLSINYVPGGVDAKIFAGYHVEGWFVSGWLDKPVTTPKFIAILQSLGFAIEGSMSATTFRNAITKGLIMVDSEDNEGYEEEHDTSEEEEEEEENSA